MTGAQRQEALRERRREDGLKELKLSLLPKVIEEFDSLRRDKESREDVFAKLVAAAVRRRR